MLLIVEKVRNQNGNNYNLFIKKKKKFHENILMFQFLWTGLTKLIYL